MLQGVVRVVITLHVPDHTYARRWRRARNGKAAVPALRPERTDIVWVFTVAQPFTALLCLSTS